MTCRKIVRTRSAAELHLAWVIALAVTEPKDRWGHRGIDAKTGLRVANGRIGKDRVVKEVGDNILELEAERSVT